MPTVTVQQAFQIAMQHHQAGRLGEAETIYRQILAQQPDHADALHLLGVVAHQAGRNAVAVDLIGQAIALDPNQGVYHCNLGLAFFAQRRLDQAIAAYRKAIQVQPDFADAHNQLGATLREQGRIEEAITACREAIRLQPDSVQALSNLGAALSERGEIDEAISLYRRAIQLRPDFAEAHYNLGLGLRAQRRFDEAIAAFRRALELRPNHAWTWNDLGNALKDACRLDEAVAAYRRAMALNPNFPEAHYNLGDVLRSQGQLDGAIAAYRQAIALRPGFAEAHSRLVYVLHFHPGFDARAISEEHRRWNAQFTEPLRKSLRPHRNDRDPERRLRVGYVSPDFWAQAESHFVVPLFEAHDQSRFEIHAYASVFRPDHVTERLQRSVSAWHDVVALSDEALDEKIREDGIDILVDLTMHMAHNRLLLFARKPAPVQVTWLAYPGSTGLETIDYRITDGFMDPPSLGTAGYSEQSVRLPDSWCCYDPLSELPPVPVESSQSGRAIRFGSLNEFGKMNAQTVRLWAKVLAAVPGSRLLLLAAEGSHRNDLRRTLGTMGVDGERVEFCGRCPREEYLRLYDRIDIALDPLPYNGITTTLDALWMGVPVVSLTGKTAAGRAGLSLLSNIGLSELVAHTPERYVQIATELASDLPRLSHLRSTLRQRLEQSPLMDAHRFARNMEAAYREVWRTWCSGTGGPASRSEHAPR